MSGTPVGRSVHLLAGISSVTGPAGAMLYESSHLRWFPGDLIYEVWLVVTIAAFGAGTGLVCFTRGARVAGTVCLLSNAAVVALYGFIAFFFSSGGSR